MINNKLTDKSFFPLNCDFLLISPPEENAGKNIIPFHLRRDGDEEASPTLHLLKPLF